MGTKKTSKFTYFLLALGISLFAGYCNQEAFGQEKIIHLAELRENSKKIDSLILLAKEKYGLGQYEEALSSANQAVLIDDSNQETYFIRGLINIKRPDWVSALNDFRKILEINPTSIVAQTMLGYMESGSGNYKIAVDRFTQSLKLEPNNSNLYAYRGHSNHLLKDYQSSINDITKALEIENEDEKEGDIADFARKTLINPEVPYSVLYSTLCSSYRNLGDFPNAIEACEGQVDHYKVKLPFEKRKHRKYIDPEFILSGNWLPQDALGGHQWNSHLSKWVID